MTQRIANNLNDQNLERRSLVHSHVLSSNRATRSEGRSKRGLVKLLWSRSNFFNTQKVDKKSLINPQANSSVL